MEDRYSFLELLPMYRTRAGLTQAQLGERLGVHRNTVIAWESGRQPPGSRNMVLDLADALELDGHDMDRLLYALNYQLENSTPARDLHRTSRIDAQLQPILDHLARLEVGVDQIVAQGRSPVRPVPGDFLLANTRQAPRGHTNPGTLLNARYEVVPFFTEARQDDLTVLDDWCRSAISTSIRLFVGPGGAGKTRLFIEWCKQLRGQGWWAGFAADALTDEQIAALHTAERPTLVAIDYAESRPDLLSLLKRIVGRPVDQSTPLRVVLLAREAADWWRSLLERDEAVRELLMQYEPQALTPVRLDAALRRRVFGQAAAAFAEHLGKLAPEPEVDLQDARFSRILYLHMAALAAVEGLPISAELLLEEILAHEKRLWARRFQAQHREDDLDAAEFTIGCSRFVAAVTLRGSVGTREEAAALLQRVNGSTEKHLVPFLRSLYPGRVGASEEGYLSGLEPDLLGEALVAAVLADKNTPSAYLEQVFVGAGEGAFRTGFFTLGRIALYRETEARVWLRRLLEADVAGRARPAFQAAMALGQQTAHSVLGRVLAMGLERGGTTELAAEFEGLLPEQTVSLREVAAWATQCLANALPAASADEAATAEQARLRINLANRLRMLGWREAARQAAEKAVMTCLELEKVQPGAFVPLLAKSLISLSIMLSDVGQREAALQAIEGAVTAYRELADIQPAAYLPDLALSLNNLGLRLSDVGQREAALEAAEEAVAVYRELAHARPTGFSADLARSLTNLSLMQSAVGLRRAAVGAAGEAVDIRRRLAADRPDAFLPDLALSLNNLAKSQSEMGWPEQALETIREAVGIRRGLAASRPDVFLPDLARSVNNLSTILSEMGQVEAALDAIEESVTIYRRLAESQPDAFPPDLARSLLNLVKSLSELGRREAALGAAEEAVRIYRELAAPWPDVFLPDLAIGLDSLGAVLNAVGRREAALAAVEEAVSIQRGLAQAQPDAFLPSLARSLSRLGVILCMSGRRVAALQVAAEAVHIRRGLAQAQPDAFVPDLVVSLNSLALQLLELGRWRLALIAAEEAVRVQREQAQTRSDTFLAGLAMSLNVLGMCLKAAGQPRDALAAFADGIGALRPGFLAWPAAFAELMAVMAREYITLADELGGVPDEGLLIPVIAKFQELSESG